MIVSNDVLLMVCRSIKNFFDIGRLQPLTVVENKIVNFESADALLYPHGGFVFLENLENGEYLGYPIRFALGFLPIAKSVEDYISKHDPSSSAVVSESIMGEYSVKKAIDRNTGLAVGWETVFARQLRPYKRHFTDVKI